ncbi:MAG: hypothetical protein JW963_08535 [Anaerolineales bacterium]|nr:hypothetical protein [Anaerolineales bacterium]
MISNRAKVLLAFAVVALIFSGATLLFWEFMRDTMLVPVYYVLWVGGLMLNSVPQEAYLVLIVFLSLVIGAETVGGLHIVPRVERVSQNQPTPDTRYLLWRNLCAYAYDNWFSKNRLVLEARKLILSILAYEQGVDLVEAEALVRNGALDVPDALRDVIENKPLPDAPLPNRSAGALSQRRLQEDTNRDPHVERLIAELISFVEHHLEITHAGNNPES